MTTCPNSKTTGHRLVVVLQWKPFAFVLFICWNVDWMCKSSYNKELYR